MKRPLLRSLPVSGFDTEEEAIRRANDTAYELSAYAMTRGIGRIRLGEQIEAGTLGINDGRQQQVKVHSAASRRVAGGASWHGRSGSVSRDETHFDWRSLTILSDAGSEEGER